MSYAYLFKYIIIGDTGKTNNLECIIVVVSPLAMEAIPSNLLVFAGARNGTRRFSVESVPDCTAREKTPVA